MNWNHRYASEDDYRTTRGHNYHIQQNGQSIGRNVVALQNLEPGHPLHDLASLAEQAHGQAINAHGLAVTAHDTDNPRALIYSARAIALSEAADRLQDSIEMMHPEHYIKVR